MNLRCYTERVKKNPVYSSALSFKDDRFVIGRETFLRESINKKNI